MAETNLQFAKLTVIFRNFVKWLHEMDIWIRHDGSLTQALPGTWINDPIWRTSSSMEEDNAFIITFGIFKTDKDFGIIVQVLHFLINEYVFQDIDN